MPRVFCPVSRPNNKVRMLRELADEVEIIVAVNAKDFARRKVRADMGTTYDDEVLRQIDEFRERGLFVGSVVITQWTDDNKAAAEVKERFEKLGIRVYRHFPIPRLPVGRRAHRVGRGLRRERIRGDQP